MAEVEIVQRGAGVARVLGHEGGDGAGPVADGLCAPREGAAVRLERADDPLAVVAEVAIARPEPRLILLGLGVALGHEVAGAAAVEDPRHGLCVRVEAAQDHLLRRREQVAGQPRRQHRTHLAQGERARDVQEEAHEMSGCGRRRPRGVRRPGPRGGRARSGP